MTVDINEPSQYASSSQIESEHLLTWLNGRANAICVHHDSGLQVLWSPEDGISIEDAILGFCKRNNIDLLKEIVSGCVEESVTVPEVEITEIGKLDKIDAEKLISLGWTEKVCYHGFNLFRALYEFGAVFEERITQHIPNENQECYLGYIADQDRFLIGFDTWPFDDDPDGTMEESDEGSYSVVKFQLSPTGYIHDIHPVEGMEPMFYKNNWKKLKELHPSLYDIRLD